MANPMHRMTKPKSTTSITEMGEWTSSVVGTQAEKRYITKQGLKYSLSFVIGLYGRHFVSTGWASPLSPLH